MTYVASPYHNIVEDLLTALTGGIVREENTFVPPEMQYYIANPSALPESVRIVGIKDKAIYNFIAGQDFDADFEKISWRDDGNLPDVGSKFYINYYRTETEPVLSDRNVGSVTRTLAEAFAKELAVLSQQLLLVYDSGFVDTAKGGSLDQVVAILGEAYARKSGDYATGEVLFYRNQPATADIFINDGLLIATGTEEPKTYETTQEKTLRKGQLSVLVPVRATKKGQDGVTEAGTITIMVQPVMGIDGITNPREISPVGKEETDDELRERAKHALEAAGKTTANALKYALMSIPELWGTDIKVEEDFTQGNGLVRVYIDTAGSEEIVGRIDQKIFETKAAGIKVVHNLSKSEDTVSAKLKTDLKKMPVVLKITLTLEDPSVPSSKKESIKGEALSAAKAYFEKLKIGESAVKNKLVAALLAIEGLKDAQVGFFAEDQTTSLPDEVRVDSNQKIALTGEPLVAIADSPVLMDIRVQAVITDQKLDKRNIEESIKDKVKALVANAGKKISVGDFKESLKGNGYNVTSLEFDIEFSESGLIKRNVSEGDEKISENEIFVLCSIDVKIS